MKKLFVIMLLICAALVSRSQNPLQVTIGEDICLSSLIITYNNESSETISMGCTGNYFFETGESALVYITVNDVQCPLDETTTVRVDEGKYADAEVRRGKITFKAKEGATRN